MKTTHLLVQTLITLFAVSPALASQQDLDRYSTKDFIVGTEKLGCQPKGMKSNHEGTLMYVAEMCGRSLNGKREATVGVIDLLTRKGKSVLITPAGSKGGILGNTEVEITFDGKYALAARAEGDKAATGNTPIYPGYGMVTAINNHNQKIVKYIPVKGMGSKIINRRPILANDPNKTQIVYVVNYFSDDVSILDVTNIKDDGNMAGDQHLKGVLRLKTAFKVIQTYNPIAPRGLAFTNDGKYGFILATNTGSIIVIDAVNHKQIAELAPIADSTFGRQVNVRHIVTTNDGKMAYLSHMRGDGVSRINLQKLLSLALAAHKAGKATLDSSTWNEIFVPFANGKSFLALPHYPKDHPNFPNQDWGLTRPNTIVLDPVNNKYLYVSHRTDTSSDYNNFSLATKGKIDIIDTTTGKVIFSAVGGSQPTALEVTPDNKLLMTAGFKDSILTFLDIAKIIRIYEQ